MVARIIGLLLGAVLIFIIFIFQIYKGNKKWRQKAEGLQLNRANISKYDFIKYFLEFGYNERSINFIYEKTQDYLGNPKFTLLPQDDFLLIYEIDKEEIIYPILDWLKEYQSISFNKEEIETLIKNQRIVDFKFLIGLFN